ncbi:tyrosyl-DNA phosphodiesterase-domain-containing protein [Xylaria sp. CBS 124048]|nr:tyrosyl-DNA phosphodiesterase-domain-containing protein [Xylaria sp. CBS 124048]
MNTVSILTSCPRYRCIYNSAPLMAHVSSCISRVCLSKSHVQHQSRALTRLRRHSLLAELPTPSSIDFGARLSRSTSPAHQSPVMDPHDDQFAGDDDAALRYAIELSLRDLNATASSSTAENLSGLHSEGNRDSDLESGSECPPTAKKSAKKSVKKSAQPTAKGSITKSPTASPSKAIPSQALPQKAGSGGLISLGLDRKKMEEERLARIAKRKAPPDDESAQQRLHRRAKIDNPASGSSLGTGTHAPSDTQPIQLPYPKGVVKKTWLSGCPRQDDIKIEEILQKDQLQLAVLSSFQWDDTWLLSKIDIRKTKMICVAFAASEAHKEEMRANVPSDRIRFCFPPMMPTGNMHSKLQLLKFPNYLRLVIPTGNLVPYDWGETGVMENMVFLIDLPAKKEASKPLTAFGQELCYFLEACGLDEGLVGSLSKYDFSETERYRFIHTIGQTHVGEAWQRTGYCGLGRAVKSLGLATSSEVQLDFVAASLGSLNTSLITAIYNAAQGDDGLKEYERRSGGGGKKKTAQKTELSYNPDNFRIYFPSHDTVRRSLGGTNAGGTICVQRKWWDLPTFPRELIHDCQSVRPRVLMHTKILFVRPSSPDKSQIPWVYLGSANLSESAWGRLVKDRATGQPKLSCRNWECGVLVPMQGGSVEPGLRVFEKTIPVPMVVPGEAYGKTSSKEPWFSFEH